MPDDLDRLHTAILRGASERGLFVFDGELDMGNLASVAWSGDWPAFLDLAQQTHAPLIYLHMHRYDPDLVITEESGDPDLVANESDGEVSALASDAASDRKAWLLARIRERIASWDTRRDEAISVSCIWVSNQIAHHWRRYADWVFDCREVIGTVLNEARQIDREEQSLRSREAARKIHEYATHMAHHPRFPEATSEEKREFMASQLFPDDNADLRVINPAGSIARRAMLIYWWNIEPAEKVSKAERAKALHEEGESIRNIAAILKMSEAKVRSALSEAP